MKQSQNKIDRFIKTSIIVSGIVCIAVFVVLAFFVNSQNNKTVDRVGGAYMASMNDRITRHYTTMINLRMTQLDTLIDALPDDAEKDSEEIRKNLEYNANIRGFESLAYYFEDRSLINRGCSGSIGKGNLVKLSVPGSVYM